MPTLAKKEPAPAAAPAARSLLSRLADPLLPLLERWRAAVAESPEPAAPGVIRDALGAAEQVERTNRIAFGAVLQDRQENPLKRLPPEEAAKLAEQATVYAVDAANNTLRWTDRPAAWHVERVVQRVQDWSAWSGLSVWESEAARARGAGPAVVESYQRATVVRALVEETPGEPVFGRAGYAALDRDCRRLAFAAVLTNPTLLEDAPAPLAEGLAQEAALHAADILTGAASLGPALDDEAKTNARAVVARVEDFKRSMAPAVDPVVAAQQATREHAMAAEQAHGMRM